MGAVGLADQLGVSEKEARALFDAYFSVIPEIKKLRQQMQTVIRARGFVRTIMGRRRYLPPALAYIGINAVVQGGAADIFKQNVVDIHKFLRAGAYKTRMINLVHDEILFNLHNSEHHIVKDLKRIMASGAPMLCVPLAVDAEIGPNWADMNPFEEAV